jgi:serine/threonine-protein kinase
MGEPADSQVRRLLEEVLNSGRSPEEVCAAHPERLEEVRRRWRRIRALADDLERAFPTSQGGETSPLSRAGPPKTLPQIAGYEVQSLIGHGGMGVVYKARHLKLDRIVALKMLRGGDLATARELASLVREAQSIAGLRHAHIVQVHDFGEHEGLPYFTMEYVDGGSLARKLEAKPMPARDAAALVATLADAVDAAHRGGVVHRDLKPSNILLCGDGVPKISDFGLARRATTDSGETLAVAGVGTPSYMAPEQAVGAPEAFEPSVDLYALGAVLYELLTGRPPFKGESSAETQRQVVSEEPVAPSRLNARVPRDLETICLKCLQKTPARRYATARELADDLGRFLRGEPIKARPIGPAERLSKWVRRSPARAVAWLGAIVALGAILGAVLWTVSQRAAIERAVSDDLTEAVRFEKAADWRAARNTLERAKTRLGAASGRDRLASHVSEVDRELELVDRLGAMRFSRAASNHLEFDLNQSWAKYRGMFVEAGLLREGDTSEAFAARVAGSRVRPALLDAMDDWTICATSRTDLEWLLGVTRLADPDPAWRDRARQLNVWLDPPALVALAREAPVEKEPVPLLLIVAGRMIQAHPEESEALIRRVLAAHPGDFWANFALAESLDARKDPDAIGFYRATIALRPDAACAHASLAMALAAQKRTDEAIDAMKAALALDPETYAGQFDLAVWLFKQHRDAEAADHARMASQIAPKDWHALGLLGRALGRSGKPCEAIEPLKKAIELAPDEAALTEFLAQAERECNSGSDGAPASSGP